MKQEIVSISGGNTRVEKVRVLVAPLDWGLGHATRCIPIIQALLLADYEVFVGAEGPVKSLLHAEFPQLTFLPLKGYNVRYGTNKRATVLRIISQVPKIIAAIKQENKWLKNIVREHKIDAVISDNRYGLYHSSAFCVFITHQLYIKTFLGKLSEKILQQINYSFIKRFKECWVPDVEDNDYNLGGELSHPFKKPLVPLTYIGTLTRFSKTSVEEKKNSLLILLSGPEPQRSILESLLLQQLIEYKEPVVLVRGLPNEQKILTVNSYVKTVNHLPARELEEAIAKATFVVSRCGYSSVMDLLTLHKKCIFIPTPGQTEQEYLAQHLMKKNYAFCINQNRFKLKAALQLADSFPYQPYNNNKANVLDTVILQLKNKLIAQTKTSKLVE